MRPKLVVLTDLLPNQVASMAGSALAGRLLAPSAGNIRVERYMQTVFAVSAVALFVPVIFNRTQALEADSLNADAPGDCRAQRLVLSILEFSGNHEILCQRCITVKLCSHSKHFWEWRQKGALRVCSSPSADPSRSHCVGG
jgi:hypothetical protein